VRLEELNEELEVLPTLRRMSWREKISENIFFTVTGNLK
jgi:hypothetical protein